MLRSIASSAAFLLVATLVLMSCDEPKETQAAPSTDSSSPDTIVRSEHVIIPSAPEIIRSPVPEVWNAVPRDTLQLSPYIRRIFQDSKGVLWFGTVTDGVCRYDGKTLTYFTSNEGFGGWGVQGIAEDPEGNLWFGTNAGVSKYDGKTFTSFSEKDGLSDSLVQSLFIDKSGTIWVGTTNGVCRFDGKGFKTFPLPGKGKELQVKCILQDRDGNMWFATNGAGAYRYDEESLTNLSQKDGLGGNALTWMMQDQTGFIWFAHDHVSRYDPLAKGGIGSPAFMHLTEKDGLRGDNRRVMMVMQDRAGRVWMSGNSGVCRYDGGSLTTFAAANKGSWGVQSIFEDRAGNVWVGSGGGLFRVEGDSLVNVTLKSGWPARFR